MELGTPLTGERRAEAANDALFSRRHVPQWRNPLVIPRVSQIIRLFVSLPPSPLLAAERNTGDKFSISEKAVRAIVHERI